MDVRARAAESRSGGGESRLGDRLRDGHPVLPVRTVEVRGRRSGRTLSFPLIAADYCGERYLVAMLGERAAWVANVRAAGGEAVIRARGRKLVHLEEVPPALRAPILKRHLEVAPAARSFSPVDHRAPVSDFEAVAADFPVFRICPASR